MLKQVHVYVHGDILGVGFRVWTKMLAKMAKLNGWVKNVYNRPDRFKNGSGIEAILQGEEEKVKEVLEEIKKGPTIAHVTHVDFFSEDPQEIYETFEIRK